MRRRTASRRGALGAIFLLMAILSSAPARAGDGGPVKPGQTIAEILDSKGKSAASAPLPGLGGLLFKLVLTAGGVSGAGLGLIFFYRKCLPSSASLHPGGEIEVVGRAALSAKHLVFVLRVAQKRIVLGVSGDRMSPLALLDGGPESSKAPLSAGGPDEARKTTWNDDLLPYRKQVDRLRGLLRGQAASEFPPEDGSKDS